MMDDDPAFHNLGTAVAAVNIYGYAIGGWPVALLETLLAGIVLGVFAAFGRDQGSVLQSTIWVMGAQISPRPWTAMKEIVSCVHSEAAAIRSASFSRSGSSATMTMRPAAISAMISSTGLN